VFPKGGNLIAAGVIGAVCGALGAGVGHAAGSLVDELLNGPPDEDQIEPASAGSVVSLVLGLFGLIAWILPIVGLPVGALGYFLGRKGTSTRQRTMALIGIGLCVLCLCLSVVNAYVGALLAVRGQM
jgi:MFS family permease